MKVTTVTVACDNPNCNRTQPPEWISANDRKHSAPYGWITLKGSVMGSGPAFDVEVCSADCLPGAVKRAIEAVQ